MTHQLNQKMKSQAEQVELLNKYLRGELAAVQTYTQAMEVVSKSEDRTVLKFNKDSHQERVVAIGGRVRLLSGVPSGDGGAWAGFAKLLEGGAKLAGSDPALVVLEEGEDHGVRLYGEDLSAYPIDLQHFVQSRLAVPQKGTHDKLKDLIAARSK